MAVVDTQTIQCIPIDLITPHGISKLTTKMSDAKALVCYLHENLSQPGTPGPYLRRVFRQLARSYERTE